MAERRYKPTPENERLVKQFIESSKRAGYDPTFTNIIVKEVKKDKTGRVRNRVASAQSKIEKKILAKSGQPKPGTKTETKTPPGSPAKKQTTIAERKRRFREAAKAFKKQEMADVYEQAHNQLKKDLKKAGVIIGRDVILPAAVGGGLGLAIKASRAVPAIARTLKVAAKSAKSAKSRRKYTPPTHSEVKKALPVRKALSGKPQPKALPPGRQNQLPSGRVPKRLPQRGTAGRQPAKQPFKPSDMKPDPTIRRLATEKGQQLSKKRLEAIANQYARQGKAANRPLTKLERIAEDYIKKPSPTKLERLAEAYIKRPKAKPRVRLKSPSKTIRKETVIGKLAKAKGTQLKKKELERIANAYASRGRSAKRPLTRLEKLAEDYVNKPTPKKLDRIAEAYIKQPKKLKPAELNRLAESYIRGSYANKLGLTDDISAGLKAFLKSQNIQSGKQLRASFAELSSKLQAMGKPARARELSRLLNLAGR